MADDKEGSFEKARISGADLLRLKHELNKSITYQGLNAKEVEELVEMSSEDYRKIRLKYAEQLKEWTIILDFIWYGLSIAGILPESCVSYYGFGLRASLKNGVYKAARRQNRHYNLTVPTVWLNCNRYLEIF